MLSLNFFFDFALPEKCSSLLRGREKCLQLLFVVMVEVVKILNLVFVGLLFPLSRLLILPDDLFDLLLEVRDVLVVLPARRFQVSDVLGHLVLALLGHEGLAHAVGDRALVQGLVGRDSHLDFITDAHQEEASLSTVDDNLTDELVKALGEELLTMGADAGLSGLASLDGSIKVVLEVDDIDLGGGLGRNVTDPEIASLVILTRWQDRVQVVLIALLLVFASLLHRVGRSFLLALGLGIGDGSGDKDGIVVSDK